MGKLGKTGGLARKVIVAMTIKRRAVGTIAMAFLLLLAPAGMAEVLLAKDETCLPSHHRWTSLPSPTTQQTTPWTTSRTSLTLGTRSMSSVSPRIPRTVMINLRCETEIQKV